ncbi:MAG: hypothetical protein QRY71_00715 [Candidatus Rhabdochlamydia sp.]
MFINSQTFRDFSYALFCYGFGLSAFKLKEAEDFLKKPYTNQMDHLIIQEREFLHWTQRPVEYNFLDLESYYSDWAFSSKIPNIEVIQKILKESLTLIQKEEEHRFFYVPQHFYPTDFLASQIMTRVIHRKIHEITLENPSLSLEKAGELAITSLQAAALLDQVERRHNPHAKLKYVTYCKTPESHLMKKCSKNLIGQIILIRFALLVLNYKPIHRLKNVISAHKINDLLHFKGLNFFKK